MKYEESVTWPIKGIFFSILVAYEFVGGFIFKDSFRFTEKWGESTESSHIYPLTQLPVSPIINIHH